MSAQRRILTGLPLNFRPKIARNFSLGFMVRTTVQLSPTTGSPVFRKVCFDARTGSQAAQGPNVPRDSAVRPMLPLAAVRAEAP